MAADQKDTTVTEESTQQETVATKAKPAAASKKLCAEELIREFESAQQKNDLPEIYVGDTVRVGVRISEGNRERVQPYEGVVISKRHGGMNQTITVRRISKALALNVCSWSIAHKSPTSRLNGAVKYEGRSFFICGNGWARPPA